MRARYALKAYAKESKQQQEEGGDNVKDEGMELKNSTTATPLAWSACEAVVSQHTPHPPPQRPQDQSTRRPPDLTALKQHAERIVARRNHQNGEGEKEEEPHGNDYYAQRDFTDAGAPGVYGGDVAWHLDSGVVYQGGGNNRSRSYAASRKPPCRVERDVRLATVRSVGVTSLPHVQSVEWSQRSQVAREEAMEWDSVLFCAEIESASWQQRTGTGEAFAVLVASEAYERLCVVDQEAATCDGALRRRFTELSDACREQAARAAAARLSGALEAEVDSFVHACHSSNDTFREFLAEALSETQSLCNKRRFTAACCRICFDVESTFREFESTFLLPQYRYSLALLEMAEEERRLMLRAADAFFVTLSEAVCCVASEEAQRNELQGEEARARAEFDDTAQTSLRRAEHKSQVRHEMGQALEEIDQQEREGKGVDGVLTMASFDAAYEIEFGEEVVRRERIGHCALLGLCCEVDSSEGAPNSLLPLFIEHEHVQRVLLYEREAASRRSSLFAQQRLVESARMLQDFVNCITSLMERTVLPQLDVLRFTLLEEPLQRARVAAQCRQEHVRAVLEPLAFQHELEMRRRQLFEEYCAATLNAVACAVLAAAKEDAARQQRPPGWEEVEREVIALEGRETKDRVFVQLEQAACRRDEPAFQRWLLQHRAVLAVVAVYRSERVAMQCHRCELAEALARAALEDEVWRAQCMWAAMVRQGDLAFLLDCADFLTVEEIVDSYVY